MSAALLVAAVQARRDSDATGSEPSRLDGITGQRQAIAFRVDEDGRPGAFATVLWGQCPGAREQRTGWTPSDGTPVAFRWHDGRLQVREDSSFEYDDGVRGFASSTMVARATDGRIQGHVRALWRFERDGREYLICDSGYVPFAAGPGAELRLSRIAPVRRPWTLYPTAPQRLPASFVRLRFARRVDDTCVRTYWELRRAERHARRRGGGHWHVRRFYVRGHAAQLAALLRLGRPPEAKTTYLRWLGNFDLRVELEQRQLHMLRRGDLAAAAAQGARIGTLKARGNAAGIAFGLRACTSNGPTGAPKS